MAKHKKLPQPGKADIEQQKRPRRPDFTSPSSLHREPVSSLPETPFRPQMDQHTGQLANVSSPEQRQDLIMQLSQAYGNRYVQRLLGTINGPSAAGPGRMDSSPSPDFPVPVQQSAPVASIKPMRDRNSSGVEVGLSTTFRTAKNTTGEDNAPSAAQATSTLAGAHDSISPGTIVLAQQTSVGGSALTGTNFGSYTPNITKNVTVEKIEGTFFDDYKVTALMTIKYTYSIQSLGKTDIPSADADAVDETSWSAIYSDLYPGEGSRSPRRWYWCSDLSASHEMYHIMDCMNAFKTMAPIEEQWLEQQSTRSKAGAERLGMQALNQLETRVFSYMGGDTPDAPQEVRAYGAGASQYIERAQAIEDRAIAEGWTDEEVEEEDEDTPGYDKEEGEIEEDDYSEEEEGEGESWWDDLWDDLWDDEEEVEEDAEEESEEAYAYNEEDYDYLYGGGSYYEEEDGYGYGEEDYGYGYEDEYEYDYEEDYGYGYGEESYNESEGYIY